MRTAPTVRAVRLPLLLAVALLAPAQASPPVRPAPLERAAILTDPSGRVHILEVDTNTPPPTVPTGWSLRFSRTATASAQTTSDPRREEQWGWRRIGGPQLASRPAGQAVLVAVLDSGVDATHPDLRDRVVPGADFVDGTTDGTVDPTGHGTHVAGIIAANTGNGSGISGVAPNAVILPVKVLDASGEGDHVDIAKGVVWAVDRGAQIVNLSIGGPESTEVLAEAIAYAQRRGVLVVAAAGNTVGPQDDAPPSYPAAYPGVLAVGATSVDDTVAMFSTYGTYVRLVAPGLAVLSTTRGGYDYLSGTSQAAPFVAGAAAVLWGERPDLTAQELVSRLERAALDLSPAGRDPRSGSGLLDLQMALTGVRTPAIFTLPALPGLGATPAPRPGRVPTAPGLLLVAGPTSPVPGVPQTYTLLTAPARPRALVKVASSARTIGTVRLGSDGRGSVRIRFTKPVELEFRTGSLRATLDVVPAGSLTVTRASLSGGTLRVAGSLFGSSSRTPTVLLRCRGTDGRVLERTSRLRLTDTVFTATFALPARVWSCTLRTPSGPRSRTFTARPTTAPTAGP